MSPHLTMPGGGGHIHRPMTGAANIGSASTFHILEGSALYFRRGRLRRLDQSISRRRGGIRIQKLIVQSFVFKVSLLVSDPFLQSPVGLYEKFLHNKPPVDNLTIVLILPRTSRNILVVTVSNNVL